MSRGTYPEIRLRDARGKPDEAHHLLLDAIDPAENRKARRQARADLQANSLEIVAREWFAKFEPTWTDRHSEKIIRRLERDIFPKPGARPMEHPC